jgi:hypothetical protein
VSSEPAKPLDPSPEAEEVLRVIDKLSERDRAWVFERIESAQQVSADELTPEWRAELQARARALADGSAELHDLDDAEREALDLLDR